MPDHRTNIMNEQRCKIPQLVLWYRDYLENGKSAAFVACVATRYSLPTLHRMTRSPDHEVRRASVLAVGMLGNGTSIDVVGRCLSDSDRCVRLVAEMAFSSLTQRQVGVEACQQLDVARRHVDGHRYQSATHQLDRLLEDWPQFADAWHLRAVVLFQTRKYRGCVRAAKQAARLNPHHFAALALVARCYLEMDDSERALPYFHRSLKVNPSQSWVRSYAEVLSRRARRLNHDDTK